MGSIVLIELIVLIGCSGFLLGLNCSSFGQCHGALNLFSFQDETSLASETWKNNFLDIVIHCHGVIAYMGYLIDFINREVWRDKIGYFVGHGANRRKK